MIGFLLLVAGQFAAENEYVTQLQREWAQCLIEKVDRYAATAESAETIARAAFGSCQEPESRYAIYMENLLRMENGRTPNLHEMVRDHVRQARALLTEQLVAEVMERRTSQR